MTREEIADKFEELARGIREGKTLEENVYGNWKIMSEERLNAFNVNSFRVKPGVAYIPFTVGDWKEFENKRITKENQAYIIDSWNESGVYFRKYGKNHHFFMTYQRLCNDYIFTSSKTPCGKQVQE